MILDHWKPKPLVDSTVDPLHQLDLDTIPVIEGCPFLPLFLSLSLFLPPSPFSFLSVLTPRPRRHQGKLVTIGGKEFVNFSSYNFLGFGQDPKIEVCPRTTQRNPPDDEPS